MMGNAIKKNISPEARNISPEARNISPEARNISPEARNISPEAGNASPEEKPTAPKKKTIGKAIGEINRLLDDIRNGRKMRDRAKRLVALARYKRQLEKYINRNFTRSSPKNIRYYNTAICLLHDIDNVENSNIMLLAHYSPALLSRYDE